MILKWRHLQRKAGSGSAIRGLFASLMILNGGNYKEKAFHSLRSFTVFFICPKPQANLGLFQIKKPGTNVQGFFFCRGGRIRTCDPLVPNQMR